MSHRLNVVLCLQYKPDRFPVAPRRPSERDREPGGTGCRGECRGTTPAAGGDKRGGDLTGAARPGDRGQST